jgi:hypothetical protein
MVKKLSLEIIINKNNIMVSLFLSMITNVFYREICIIL